MKKNYTGLKAEKIDFGSYNMATASSIDGCIQVVANLKVGNVCVNPEDTQQLMWILDNPYE